MSNSEALRGFIPQDAKPQTTQSVNPLADQVHASAFLGEGVQAYEQHLEAATLPERRSIPSSSQDKKDGQDKAPRGGKGKIAAAIAAGVGALGVAGTLFFGADNQNKPKVSDSTPTKTPEPATETVAVLPTEDTFPTFTTIPTPTSVGGIDGTATDPEQTNVAETTPVQTPIKIEETQTKPPETKGLHYEVEGAEWFGGFTVEGFELKSGEKIGFSDKERGPQDLLDSVIAMAYYQNNGNIPMDANGNYDRAVLRSYAEQNGGSLSFALPVIDQDSEQRVPPYVTASETQVWDMSTGMDILKTNDVPAGIPKMKLAQSSEWSAFFINPSNGKLTFVEVDKGAMDFAVSNAWQVRLYRLMEATARIHEEAQFDDVRDNSFMEHISKQIKPAFANKDSADLRLDLSVFYGAVGGGEETYLFDVVK